MTALPIVEAARERLSDKPELLALLDDAVLAHFELVPAEVKALCGLLLAGGNLLEASRLAGTSSASFQIALDNLAKRNLVEVKSGQVDLAGLQARLRVEGVNEADRDELGIPEPKIVFRSLLEQVIALATSHNNPSVGLGRAYAFIFGRKTKNFPVLGRIAKELGARRAARFLLEHALDDFGGQEPLTALLPQALWLAAAIRNGGVRPEDAPDLAERAAELTAEAEHAWRERMRRWDYEYGGELHALATIDQNEADKLLNEYQAEAMRRQVKLDYDLWRKRGEPKL